MKSKKIAEMSDAQLVKSFKVLTAITYLFAASVLILFIACTFYITMNGFSAIFLAPLGLVALLMVNFSSMNRMRKELAARDIKGPNPNAA